MGGYILPSQDHAANTGETLQSQETRLGEEDEDEDHAANNGENLDDMDSTKRGLGEATLTGMWMTMNLFPILKRKIWSAMMKVMRTMILASSIIQIRPLPIHLLLSHSIQILGKIWLILHVFRYHLFLLRKMGCILVKG